MKDSSSAYYIHCFAHQLQLTLVAMSKKHLDVEDFFCHVTNVLNVIGVSFKLIEHEGSTSNERNQAKYLLSEIITFKFVFMLHLMLKVLAISNELNKILQKRDQDIVNAVKFLNITKKRLQDMRETGWESLLDDVY
ncbi:uncharacterized protein [Nicotiana tomentosiformis]|uniref:uncharacterized protein n=1 Tax=Nicotiana tomentosiformis TaxID=4098 RepID=UPI00388CA784